MQIKKNFLKDVESRVDFTRAWWFCRNRAAFLVIAMTIFKADGHMISKFTDSVTRNILNHRFITDVIRCNSRSEMSIKYNINKNLNRCKQRFDYIQGIRSWPKLNFIIKNTFTSISFHKMLGLRFAHTVNVKAEFTSLGFFTCNSWLHSEMQRVCWRGLNETLSKWKRFSH